MSDVLIFHIFNDLFQPLTLLPPGHTATKSILRGNFGNLGYVVAYVVKIATPRNATRPTNSNNSENFGLNDALFRCPKAPIQNLEHSKCRKMLRKVYNKCFKKN